MCACLRESGPPSIGRISLVAYNRSISPRLLICQGSQRLYSTVSSLPQSRSHFNMSSPVCIPEYPPLGPTYGAWLVSLFLETILYGIGALQCFLYFQWWSDGWRIKTTGECCTLYRSQDPCRRAFETIQIVFFFHSTYIRFVERFGFIQTDLLWSDSVQLLANYLSAVTVQIYFASRIYQLTSERIGYNSSRSGIYIVLGLAVTGVAAGITQTILTYELRSFLKLEETKAITTLQTAASLACDVVITVYLCVFLHRNKTGIPRTNTMLNTLIINAVNRGMLTFHLGGRNDDPISGDAQYVLLLPRVGPEQQILLEQHARNSQHAPIRPREG
ncbi:hypothetical protein C8J57DRAFT_253584 [Mycena rebaudengoi]|nr:hypothetical protein C8J57DRAFT_253584 [Mycena rebaudengoi]